VVLIEHPLRAGYTVTSEPKPVETTPSVYRFRLPVAAKDMGAVTVREESPRVETVSITSLGANEVRALLVGKKIGPKVEAALQEFVALRAAETSAEDAIEAIETESSSIFDDQERIRENLKALKGTPEEKALIQRYTGQLNAQETQLAELKTKLEAARKVEAAAAGRVEKAVAALKLTATKSRVVRRRCRCRSSLVGLLPITGGVGAADFLAGACLSTFF